MNLSIRISFLVGVFVCSLVLVGAAPQDAKKDAQPAPAQKAEGGKKEEAKGDAAKGKEIFQVNCDICHNADSDEPKIGPGLKGLFKKPPHKMADGTEHKEHTVELIRDQIVKGSSAMPPIGAGLSEKELNDVIAFLQTL